MGGGLGPVAGREIRRLALARPGLTVWFSPTPAPFIERKRLDEMRSPVRTLPISGGTEWVRVWVLGASMPPPGASVSTVW